MTQLTAIAAALADVMNPVTGLGVAVTVGSTAVNALVAYGQDVEGEVLREVCDVTLRRADYDDPPSYRTTATIEGESWTYHKQIAGDAVTRTLRFRKNERATR